MQKVSSILNQSSDQKSFVPHTAQGKQSSFFSPVIQPKLTIGQPNDVYEQEADSMSDKVMKMSPGTGIQQPFFNPSVSMLQRKCAHCEAEEKVQRKFASPQSEGLLQLKSENGDAADAGASASIAEAIRSPGQQLDDATKNFMSPRFGYDFSSVRVHTDTLAAKSADAINALAYTSGNNIIFNTGQYSPGTNNGKRLLGHELTHVVQQSGAGQGVQRQKDSIVKAATTADKKNGVHYSALPSANLTAKNISTPVIQRAMTCSKRLEAPGLGLLFNHSYIDDTGRNDCLGSGLAGNYAVQNLVSGNFVRGCAAKTDRSTDPQSYTPNAKPCNPKPGVTNVSTCLRDAYNSYADPSVYANPTGPNSNSFAATLARACCDDSSSSGLGWVPGWDHSAAPPCPAPAPAAAPAPAPQTQTPERSVFDDAASWMERGVRGIYGIP